jgi:integrase
MVLRQIERLRRNMAGGSGRSLEKIALTHRSIETMKPAAEAYRVPDLRCPGLAIRIAPSGLKTWDMAFRIRGTASVKRKALGAFPSVSIDEARTRAAALARAAQAGRDMLAEEAEAKAEASARLTIDLLIDEYAKRAIAKLRTKREIVLRLRRALLPIASKMAHTVRRRDIRVLLDATSDRGVLREAEKQRQSAAAMFNWAVSQDIVEANPVTGLKPYSTGALRNRVLSPAEIKVLWDWIATSDLTADMADSLRLQLTLGARIGEVAGIQVSEIDDNAWVWKLPGERSKNKTPRITPIVGIAREILSGRLARTRRGPLFINETGAFLKSNDIGSAIVTRRKRIPLPHFVSHDLRRTVATELVEMGIGYELVAAILGHESGTKAVRTLTRHYVRSDFLDRKRVALEAWDARLCQIIAGNVAPQNVVLLDVMRRDAI